MSMLTPATATREQLLDFVVNEARLLDEKRFDEWNVLFTGDGIYWVPLTPGQPDGLTHTSHLYEDKLLRDLRIERLKSPRAFSQQPPSRSQHVLQMPAVESRDEAGNRFVLRTPFHYSEAQADEMLFLTGVAWHHLCVEGGELRMMLKRVDLINSDAALPAVQLFL